MKSITHVLNKNYATFNKIAFVKIKNALFAKDKAPSEAAHTNWVFHYSHPASGILTLEEPGNRIRSWYPVAQDIHDSSQLQ